MKGDAHSNTVEGAFSIFKRGMRDIYQPCSERHVERYLVEFDFRYSNRIALGVDDTRRAETALQGVRGKRLTYEQLVSGGRPPKVASSGSHRLRWFTKPHGGRRRLRDVAGQIELPFDD